MDSSEFLAFPNRSIFEFKTLKMLLQKGTPNGGFTSLFKKMLASKCYYVSW